MSANEDPNIPYPSPESEYDLPSRPSYDATPVEQSALPAVPPLPPGVGSAPPLHPYVQYGGAAYPQPAPAYIPAAAPKERQTANRRKGLAGALTAIGAALAKFWAVIVSVLLKLKGLLVALKFLTVGKLLIAGGSMMLSMFLYASAFGWPMGVGIVMLFLVHESGHALAALRLGKPIGMMVFIPFMGALVTTGPSDTAVESAFIGIMGPVAGTLGSMVCLMPFFVTHQPFWLALAAIGFFLNLINLAPAPILDGGRIAALFSPKLLLPGLALTFLIFWRNPMIWFLALMSLPRLLSAWKTGAQSPYYQVSTQDKWVYGVSYLGLVLFLLFAYTLIQTYLIALRHLAI
ncbi:MAG TPA: hypothetical protein VKU00_23430 [Chthonomonadaceae bacterium]|nr:hypothetical protein [Chthonomonadaceae bacterium]